MKKYTFALLTATILSSSLVPMDADESISEVIKDPAIIKPVSPFCDTVKAEPEDLDSSNLTAGGAGLSDVSAIEVYEGALYIRQHNIRRYDINKY